MQSVPLSGELSKFDAMEMSLTSISAQQRVTSIGFSQINNIFL